jgi:hypothetical protein
MRRRSMHVGCLQSRPDPLFVLAQHHVCLCVCVSVCLCLARSLQVAALSALLEGAALPPSIALLGGRLEGWLRGGAGLGAEGLAWLAPSVR